MLKFNKLIHGSSGSTNVKIYFRSNLRWWTAPKFSMFQSL